MDKMTLRSAGLWIAGAVLVALAYRELGWMGVALVAGAILMWALLHITRIITVMKRAAHAPMGHVASAVMLNAKLRKGVNLLHVMALTRSLGLLQSDKDMQPEVYRWSDASGSHVTLTFMHGKLEHWSLWRPESVQSADGGQP